MGQIARMSRCDRFIEAFEPLLKLHFLSRLASSGLVESQGFAMMGGEQVREYVVLREGDGQFKSFVDEYVWFEPDDDIGTVLYRLEPLIKKMGADGFGEVVRLLTGARLFDSDIVTRWIEKEVKRCKKDEKNA